MHLLYKCLLGSGLYQLGIGGYAKRLHMGSPLYDKETEVNHRCLITSNNVLLIATTAKQETFITLLSEDRR